MKNGASDDSKKTCPVHTCHAVHVGVVTLVQRVVQGLQDNRPLLLCSSRVIHVDLEQQAVRDYLPVLPLQGEDMLVLYPFVKRTTFEAVHLDREVFRREVVDILLEW